MALRRILKGRHLVAQKSSSSATSSQTRSSKPQKSSHENPDNLDAETSTIPVKSGPSHTVSATSAASRSASSTKSISIDDDSNSDSDSSSSSGNSKNSNFGSDSSSGFFNQKGNDDKTSSSSIGSSNGGNSGGNSGSSNSDSNNDSDSNSSSENKFSGSPFGGILPCEVVSDNDGQLQYTGTWTLESKDPNGIYCTSHTTSSAGSQVSIAFNGTSVTVIGVVHASNASFPPAVASYQIDNDDPVVLPLPISTRDIPNQQFFESPNLPLTAHKLLINVTSNGSPYTLDMLSICSKSTNSISDVLAPTPPSSTPKDLPEIIAVVVGGVAVLLLFVFGAILLRRKRRKTKAKRTVRSPIWSWLQRQTLFTSSESIMRNNPSNPSTVDPYDKLSAAERARSESAKNNAPAFSDKADSNVLPSLKRESGGAASDRSSVSPRRKSDDSSWLLPVLSLDSESLSDKLSDKMPPDSAHPESYMSLPPRPPLVVKRGSV